jgi:hypothetical protein
MPLRAISSTSAKPKPADDWLIGTCVIWLVLTRSRHFSTRSCPKSTFHFFSTSVLHFFLLFRFLYFRSRRMYPPLFLVSCTFVWGKYQISLVTLFYAYMRQIMLCIEVFASIISIFMIDLRWIGKGEVVMIRDTYDKCWFSFIYVILLCFYCHGPVESSGEMADKEPIQPFPVSLTAQKDDPSVS